MKMRGWKAAEAFFDLPAQQKHLTSEESSFLKSGFCEQRYAPTSGMVAHDITRP